MLVLFVFTLWLLLTPILGNVEKVIFTAPESTLLPNDASIDNLLLITLSPEHPSVRTFLNVTFPSVERPKGTESWLLLKGLNPGQRYEVRVCWAATQPTMFWLYEHLFSETFEAPALMSSLTSYAYVRHAILGEGEKEFLASRRQQGQAGPSSALFLQIHAAAEYFSLNQTLMTQVPPVFVDIILDSYVLNIFPRSLIPTAVFIVFVAVGAWYLAAWTAAQLLGMLTNHQDPAAINVEEVRDKKLL